MVAKSEQTSLAASLTGAAEVSWMTIWSMNGNLQGPPVAGVAGLAAGFVAGVTGLAAGFFAGVTGLAGVAGATGA